MQVMVSAATRSLVLPYSGATETLFPHGRVLDWKGSRIVVVPHRTTEVRLLRNLGVDVPSPILSLYDWRGGTPFGVQKETAAMLTLNPRAYVLSGMGTGKTRSVLWASDYLMRQGEIKRALVLAPLSTLHVVWRQEIMRALPGRRVGILHGSRQQRLDTLAQDHDYFIINHDGVTSIAEALRTRPEIDLVVIDELSTMRNGSTDRWKNTHSIVKDKHWVWGLTGSPTPQSPLDAWAQAKLITPERVDKAMTHFKDRVLQKVGTFTWLPRADSANIVADALKPSVRFRMEDVTELPPISYNRRDVTISAASAKTYNELVKSYRSVMAGGTAITAVNEGVMVGKLLQVSCGLVYDDKGDAQDLGPGDRYDVVRECLDATDRKVIVFVPYLHALAALSAKLKKDKYDVAVISGETSPSKRSEIFTKFETTPFIKAIIAHPRTMAHGVTLVAANTVVWYSPAPSFEIYEQANARVRRPGQKHSQLVVECCGTQAERMRYRQLRLKESMQGSVLALINGVVED